MVQHRYTPPPLRRPLGLLAGLTGEVEATAACVARYPFGLIQGALTTGRPSGEVVHDTPVLLVHGYAHNESGWWVLDRRLRQAGFTSIHRINYLPLGSGIPQLAERLDARVAEICDLTGAETVHIVGHSMGGLLLRWYIQELGGHRRVDTAITLGSPHEGTLAAWLWPERTARDMRPGSSVISRLSAGSRATGVRWVSIFSDADLLIRPTSAARLRSPQMRATNICVRGLGHLSLLVSPRVVRTVVDQLEAAEGIGARVTPLATGCSDLDAIPSAPSGSVAEVTAIRG